VLLPAYGYALPGGEVASWLHWSSSAEVWTGFAVGVLALLVAPGVTRGLAAAELGMVRGLLTPSGAELLTAKVSSLTESRARVVDAADAERRRIERDLHDGTQQHLVSLAMNLGMAKEKLDSDPEAARQLVADAHQQAKDSITELRNVIRGVYPAVLTDRGLDAALSALAVRSPVPVRLQVDLPRRPNPTAEAIAYFVVSESLTNVARHSGARSATVYVEQSGDRLKLAIVDDGRGGAVEAAGSGLTGLRDRVTAVDGRFTLTSPPGGGTTIAVEVPCES
jgi:signal transduction histidine kinase